MDDMDLLVKKKRTYTLYEINHGVVKFKVRAAQEALIALAASYEESDVMYEIVIGGWSNTKTLIRNVRTNTTVKETYTLAILSEYEFRTFWVCWDDRSLAFGYERDFNPIIMWTASEDIPVKYVGFCVGAGSWVVGNGSFQFEERLYPADLSNQLGYVFFPNDYNFVKFKVRALCEARIALTEFDGESSHMYEVFIGGSKNTTSSINKNRSNGNVVEVATPDVLSEHEYQTYWLRWDNNTISCGVDGTSTPFLSWTDENNMVVNYVGFCTEWGPDGSWIICSDRYLVTETTIEFPTENNFDYIFIPNDYGFVEFKVRASNDAHIALTTSDTESCPMYEILLCSWNDSKTAIRKNHNKLNQVEVVTPKLLDQNEFRTFWVKWHNNAISCGRSEDKLTPFISWTDEEKVPIKFIGFRTAWGSTGSWIITPDNVPKPDPVWIPAKDGDVPPGAYVAGDLNGEHMYVIRAPYEGDLIPGHLLASQRHGCVPWKYKSRNVQEYEVLCDYVGKWHENAEGNFPPNAFDAGKTKDGEPLHVGRVFHDNKLTIGKVQKTHACCYTSEGDLELNFKVYDVLVL